MKRRVEKIEPYPFASDFRAPEPVSADAISMTTQELALLLSDAQAGGASIARNDALAEAALSRGCAVCFGATHTRAILLCSTVDVVVVGVLIL